MWNLEPWWLLSCTVKLNSDDRYNCYQVQMLSQVKMEVNKQSVVHWTAAGPLTKQND